jgi:hypothetical protein
MTKKKAVVTRRDFIRGTVGASLGATLLGPEWLKGTGNNTIRSSVVIVRDRNAMDGAMNVDKQVLKKMLEQTVMKVSGKDNITDAWLSLVSPDDIIGLVPTPHLNPTHDEVIDAVKRSLVAAGIPTSNIRNAQGRSVNLSSITALISLPGLKAHWLTGIGTVLKNYIMYSGAPRNYHHQDSAKLGEIWNRPEVKGKTRLVLVDALYPLCDKGPQPDPRYKWAYNGLIAGTDPVAVETVCLKIITAKRQDIKGEPWPLSPPPICLEAADRVYKLGTSNLKNIDVQTIGWKQDLLV